MKSLWWQEQELRSAVSSAFWKLYQAEEDVKRADKSITPLDCAFQTHFTGLGSSYRTGGFARLDSAEQYVKTCEKKWKDAIAVLNVFLASKPEVEEATSIRPFASTPVFDEVDLDLF